MDQRKKHNHGSILLFFIYYMLHYRLTYAENEPKMLLLLVFFSTHRSCLVTIFKVNTMHDINTAYVFCFCFDLNSFIQPYKSGINAHINPTEYISIIHFVTILHRSQFEIAMHQIEIGIELDVDCISIEAHRSNKIFHTI